MARVAPAVLPVLRATLDDPERVRERARELGIVRRQGKVDAYALVEVVVLGVAARGATVIAQLGHTLAEATGVRLPRSSLLIFDRGSSSPSLGRPPRTSAAPS